MIDRLCLPGASPSSGAPLIPITFTPLAKQVNDAPPQTTVWGYSPNDDVLIMQDAKGSETFTKYDAINRPIAVRIFRAGQHDSFAGDPIFAPAPVSIATNGPAVMVTGTTVQNFQYDGLSRQTYAFDNNDPTTATDDRRGNGVKDQGASGRLTRRCCPASEPAAVRICSMRLARPSRSPSRVQLMMPACDGFCSCRCRKCRRLNVSTARPAAVASAS
jgi:hypothetical protein